MYIKILLILNICLTIIFYFKGEKILVPQESYYHNSKFLKFFIADLILLCFAIATIFANALYFLPMFLLITLVYNEKKPFFAEEARAFIRQFKLLNIVKLIIIYFVLADMLYFKFHNYKIWGIYLSIFAIVDFIVQKTSNKLPSILLRNSICVLMNALIFFLFLVFVGVLKCL